MEASSKSRLYSEYHQYFIPPRTPLTLPRLGEPDLCLWSKSDAPYRGKGMFPWFHLTRCTDIETEMAGPRYLRRNISFHSVSWKLLPELENSVTIGRGNHLMFGPGLLATLGKRYQILKRFWRSWLNNIWRRTTPTSEEDAQSRFLYCTFTWNESVVFASTHVGVLIGVSLNKFRRSMALLQRYLFRIHPRIWSHRISSFPMLLHPKSRMALARSIFNQATLTSSLLIFYQIEILSWMTRAALEIIGQSGMGYSFDSLTNNRPSHPYTTAAKRLMYVFLHPILFIYLNI